MTNPATGDREPTPAFPLHMETMSDCEGLSKREYMAAAIMAGLCANSGGPYQANCNNGWGIVNCAMHDIANEAVNLADALLAALSLAEGKKP